MKVTATEDGIETVVFTTGQGRDVTVKMSGNCLVITTDDEDRKLVCSMSEDFKHRLAYIWIDKA